MRVCVCVSAGNKGSYQSEPEASVPGGRLRGERDAEDHQRPLQRHEDQPDGHGRAQPWGRQQQIQIQPGFQGKKFPLV